jgi:hypothetical protein
MELSKHCGVSDHMRDGRVGLNAGTIPMFQGSCYIATRVTKSAAVASTSI